ncbi:Protein numb [Merluccius polli]|uniref:Protein numb n=1 Tax=Merluccius polli TaxID=89951 RepID=A0AA47NAX2_MERPO|nr:Protein numb [Merluccius polli]
MYIHTLGFLAAKQSFPRVVVPGRGSRAGAEHDRHGPRDKPGARVGEYVRLGEDTRFHLTDTRADKRGRRSGVPGGAGPPLVILLGEVVKRRDTLAICDIVYNQWELLGFGITTSIKMFQHEAKPKEAGSLDYGGSTCRPQRYKSKHVHVESLTSAKVRVSGSRRAVSFSLRPRSPVRPQTLLCDMSSGVGEMGEAIELSTREQHVTPEMNKLRQSLRRKKPTYVPEASRPHQWQADEEAVRKGKCNFAVRYLGLVEVEESRGMHVCEEAVKKLKDSGKKTVKAVLWVSADGLRVVDDKTKDLIVDQTIEKVSFCAPDRNYDKAFSYICRDGTTRRWICHCFMALKDSGERLSHAVGCAFAACLERKQRREKECGVTASFDASRTSFVREGSFRVASSSSSASSGQQGVAVGGSERDDIMKLQEKKKDMPCIVPALPPGTASPPEGTGPGGPHAIPRRHAPIEQLVRQGSFRGFPALSGKNSPFKRQLSLRLNDLPSTLQRRTDFETKNPGGESPGQRPPPLLGLAPCNSIPAPPPPFPHPCSSSTSVWHLKRLLEMDMGLSDEPDCNINALCSQINTSFTKPPDEFFSHPPSSSNGLPACTAPPALPPPPAPVQATSSWVQADPPLHSPPAVSMAMQMHSGHRRTPSEAERWLEEVAKAVRAQQQTPPPSSMAPPPAPTIPTIPGPPTMSSQSITNQVAKSSGPVSSVSMSHGCMSNPLMSGPSSVSGPPPMPLPPMSLSSIPLIPGPPMSGPPMSLPSMSIPTMSAPSMSGAPMMQPSLPGPPGSLPSSMQPFPLVFDANPAPVGMFAGQPVQPVQPAFVPMQTYMPGLASGMTYPNASGLTYPNASVPVVGITPSQMVANVFCTAATGSSGGAMGSIGGGPKWATATLSPERRARSDTEPEAFRRRPFPPANRCLRWRTGCPRTVPFPTPAVALLNGNTNGGGNSRGSSAWPPEGSQLTAPASSVSQEADRFEAKWAALETKPAPVSKAPVASTANPFSNDLQKTFEIEL